MFTLELLLDCSLISGTGKVVWSANRTVASDGKVGPGTVIKASVLVKQKEEVFYSLCFRLEVKELLGFLFFWL